MLHSVDRIQIVNAAAGPTAERWQRLLDAAVVGTDAVGALGARRVQLALGDALVDVLEPDGEGPVADHLNSGRGGPFAVGLSTDDLPGLIGALAATGATGVDIGDGWYFSAEALGIPGLAVVLSAAATRTPVGLMDNLYETTHLTADADAAARSISSRFELDPSQFVAIDSETYGYAGTLTLFDNRRLDRIETIHPRDTRKTMGRYFERFGPALYMCYGETRQLPAIRDRLKAIAPDDWTGSDDNPDGLFIHPRALGGTMLGISRRTHAWTWSGFPERRRAPGAETT